MLDKKKFYEQLKQFTNKYIPISIDMRVNENSKYKIILDECRTTVDKNMKLDFILQIIDTTKCGYEKYVCNDIDFNLIKEGIMSDYQLYKHIDRILKDKIGE